MNEKIIVVGCGQTKLDIDAPARDLYTGSLFVSQRRYAEASGCRWGILSAKHGFVLPDQVLAPYDVQLGGNRDVRSAWAHRAAVAFCGAFLELAQLRQELGPHVPLPVEVECLAGETYAECFVWEVKQLIGIDVRCPLRGQQLGERRHWLSLHSQQRQGRREARP
jgi:hypothetical protein